MQHIQYKVRQSIRLYVNSIMMDASEDLQGSLRLPIYADGYPGLMFQKSAEGFTLLPKNKKLSDLFLYGQTIKPVCMTVEGPYKFIILQLYPFASKYLLNVDPKILNDDCYDLLQLKNIAVKEFHEKLCNTEDSAVQIEIMSDLIEALLTAHQVSEDDRIQKAILYTIQSGGQLKVNELKDLVCLTERTLERNFLQQVGLPPKQFAKIIQFQTSLEKINSAEFDKIIQVSPLPNT